MGWTGSTRGGGVEGEICPVNLHDLDQEMRDVSRLKGKIVLAVAKGNPKKDSDTIFVRFGDFLRAALKAGALVVIAGQGGVETIGMKLTRSAILGFNADLAVLAVS